MSKATAVSPASIGSGSCVCYRSSKAPAGKSEFMGWGPWLNDSGKRSRAVKIGPAFHGRGTESTLADTL